MDVYIIKHPQWEPFVKDKTTASYEQIDDFLNSIGLDQVCDVNAGAFYSDNDKIVYCDELWFLHLVNGEKRARFLFKHEFGHGKNVPLSDHPTDLVGGFKHAHKVGYDDRAFSWLLRFHYYEPDLAEFNEWVTGIIARWKAGSLWARNAP